MPDGSQFGDPRANMLVNLPNIITFARLCAVPVAVGLVLYQRPLVAFWLFAAAGLSDALDGWLARRRGITLIGAILDPVADKALAEKYVRETIFKGQITSQDFNDAIANSPYSYDVTPEHIQITTDVMVKYGVGKMAKPALAKDWVETDLLNEAKKSLNVK